MIEAALWCAVTIALYVIMMHAQRLAGGSPLAHPVLTTTLAAIALLLVFRVPYAQYARATAGISFMLAPATIAIALPLHRELAAVRARLLPIVAGIAAGSATVVLSAIAIAHALGCDDAILRSLASKALTTPVALAVSAQIGGVPALAAVFSILSGIIGAVASPLVLQRFPARFAGLGVGTAAHGVGTAHLFTISPVASAFSGLAMGLNAIGSALVLPPLIALLWR